MKIEAQIADTVKVLVPAHFATFIVQILRRWPTATKAMETALVERVGEGDVSCWTPVLHGLGLATADLIASRWLEISRECGVDDRFAALVMSLAMAGSTFEGIPNFAPITAASKKFPTIAVDDLRWPVLKHLKSPESSPSFTLDTYHQLIAAFDIILPLPPPQTRISAYSGK